MRKHKKNENDNDGFIKNEAFENEEIPGIDVSTKYGSQYNLTGEGSQSSTPPAVPVASKIPEENITEETHSIPSDDKPLPDDEPADAAKDTNSENPGKNNHAAATRLHIPPKEEVLVVIGSTTGIFYNFFYFVGIQSFRYGKRVFVRLGRFLMKPLRYIYALFRVFVLGVDRIFFRSVRAVHEEGVFFRKEIKSSIKYLHLALKEDPMSIFSILWHYIKKAFAKHTEMFRTTANLGMPIAALVVLFLTVTYWSSATFSLKLTYEDKNLGYVQDESVYIKAQSLANERLGDTGDSTKTSGSPVDDATANAEKAQLEKPVYELAHVKLNELSDESALFDNLIEKSDQNLTNACGIFIDGIFVGAVKNETDATGVFDSILEPYKSSDASTLAAFVEEVKFTQGLYPDNTKMMDAKQLKDLLSGRKAEATYHEVAGGETIWSIAKTKGMSENALLAMNPGTTQAIRVADKIKVSNDVNYIRVKLIKTEVRTADIGFEIINTNNSNLFKGDSRIVRAGVLGQDSIKELVTYIDGVRISAKEIERTRILEPIAQKVDIGTKSTTVYSSKGSYSVSVSKDGFVWPVPTCRSVSSPYGSRRGSFHNGVDIAGSGTKGMIIVAAKDGVVESVSSGNSLGNYILINNGGGIKTGYAHCLSGSISVSAGQHVSAGQAIARVGATGNATGPHLHFNLIINGSNVNPIPYIS